VTTHENSGQSAWSAGGFGEPDLEQDDGESGIGDEGGLIEQTVGEPTLGSFDRMMDRLI
jgi:hypothetical protein